MSEPLYYRGRDTGSIFLRSGGEFIVIHGRQMFIGREGVRLQRLTVMSGKGIEPIANPFLPAPTVKAADNIQPALAAFTVWAHAHPGNWKIGQVSMNGVFHHFMDPETDSAWMGFLGAWPGPDDRPTGHVDIEHDGFSGDIIGHYETREGKRGVVLQQDRTRVVHVYGERWVKR